jgi:POT family proton-dependent oligopeptide transporter
VSAILSAADRESDHSFVGHPRGLGYLAFTEAWERFSYYGMQTLLVLYMVRQLLHPGHIERIAGFTAFRAALERAYGTPLSTVALASAIFGLYSGLVYLTPIAGGIIADRWLGRTRTITIGALLMAIGHFLMAFDQSFLIALLCLLIGVGCCTRRPICGAPTRSRSIFYLSMVRSSFRRWSPAPSASSMAGTTDSALPVSAC